MTYAKPVIYPSEGDPSSFNWPPDEWAAKYEIKQIPSLVGEEFYEVIRYGKNGAQKLKAETPKDERFPGFVDIRAARQAIYKDNARILEDRRRAEFNRNLPVVVEIYGEVYDDVTETDDAD